jgi:hypothetical protein
MFPIYHEILTKDEEGNQKIEYYEGFRGEESDYSMVVDENNFIWIMRTYNTIPGTIANSGDVWRGKLNRLGFARQ